MGGEREPTPPLPSTSIPSIIQAWGSGEVSRSWGSLTWGLRVESQSMEGMGRTF